MSRLNSSNCISSTSHRDLPFQTTKKIEFFENRNGIKRLDLHTNTLGKWDNLIARTEPSLPSSPKNMLSPRNKEFQQANRTIFPEYNSEIEKPISKRHDLPFREKSPAFPGRITNLYEKSENEGLSNRPASKRQLYPSHIRAESTKDLFNQSTSQEVQRKVHPRKVSDYYSSITTLPASTVRERDQEVDNTRSQNFIGTSATIKQYQLRSGIASLPASEVSLKVNKTNESKSTTNPEVLLARNISTSYLTHELLNIPEKGLMKKQNPSFEMSNKFLDESKQINPLTRGKKGISSPVLSPSANQERAFGKSTNFPGRYRTTFDIIQ